METDTQFAPLRCKALPKPPKNHQAGLALLSNHLSLVGRAGGTTVVPDLPSLQDVLVTAHFPLGHITLTGLLMQQVRYEKRKLNELYQDPRVKAMSN